MLRDCNPDIWQIFTFNHRIWKLEIYTAYSKVTTMGTPPTEQLPKPSRSRLSGTCCAPRSARCAARACGACYVRDRSRALALRFRQELLARPSDARSGSSGAGCPHTSPRGRRSRSPPSLRSGAHESGRPRASCRWNRPADQPLAGRERIPSGLPASGARPGEGQGHSEPPRTTSLAESKGERAQRPPDDASTAGSAVGAIEERSESRGPERARAS
jgi:hypothetical protein